MSDSAPNQPPHYLIAPSARERWQLLLLGLVLLLCGVAIGAAGTVLFWHYHMRHVFEHPERIPGQITDRLEAGLRLTPDQRGRIEKIIHQHHEKLMAFHQQEFARMDAEIKALRDEIAAVLTPEQAKQWQENYQDLLPMPRPFHRPPPGLFPGGPDGPGGPLPGPGRPPPDWPRPGGPGDE